MVAELGTARKGKELKLKTLSSIAAEQVTLRSNVSPLKDSVKTLGQHRKEVVTLFQKSPDMEANSNKVQADAGALKMRNGEQECEVKKNVQHIAEESAPLKIVMEELISVKEKPAANRTESAISHWTAHSVAKSASKDENNMNHALMAVSGKATAATKQKASIMELELKDAFMRVSTQI